MSNEATGHMEATGLKCFTCGKALLYREDMYICGGCSLLHCNFCGDRCKCAPHESVSKEIRDEDADRTREKYRQPPVTIAPESITFVLKDPLTGRLVETPVGDNKWRLTWAEVYRRLCEAPGGKLWGVPRGGQIVAGLTGRAVDSLAEADVIVDDIVDSGRTRSKYAGSGKKFWALIDKSEWLAEGRPWVIFPWEQADQGVEETVVRQLEFIGEDPQRDGLKETPRRVIKALGEMTRGYRDDPQSILAKVFQVPHDEMVVLRDMEFWSLCEHHLLPFHGRVHVGYLPAGAIVGISKLARLVDCFARRLQVQERLTQQIANAVEKYLKPRGVGVVVKATHMCMAMRGVEKPADMVTSCLLGALRDDARARSEFLGLANP